MYEVGHKQVTSSGSLFWNGFEFVDAKRFCEMGYTLDITPGNIVAKKNEPKVGPVLSKDAIETALRLADKEELFFEIIRRIESGNDLREGLAETPHRVVKAFKHWFGGYGMDPATILKTFEDGAKGCNEMVMVREIPIYSKCEHHLADIFGTATIAYIPNGKIVGLSKLSRLADGFARRLQVQERLTTQIADALQEHLNPLGVGVLIKARHMCMESRGICQQGHHTVTQALRGVMLSEPAARAEFLALAR